MITVKVISIICSLVVGILFTPLILANKKTFSLTSPNFDNGTKIPRKFSCHGENSSPALEWHNAPKKTKSFALICDDPDAAGQPWVHWIVYNIPSSVNQLPEAVELAKLGASEGENSWNTIGYGGPCPPSGTHRYVFKLYALDSMLDLPVGITKQKLLQALQGHILQQTELIGTFSNPQ